MSGLKNCLRNLIKRPIKKSHSLTSFRTLVRRNSKSYPVICQKLCSKVRNCCGKSLPRVSKKASTLSRLIDLISAREDGHLDTGVLAKGHAVLLSLLAGQENETVHAELIEQLAKVYSLTDGKGIPEGLESNLTQAAHNLHRLSDKFWPLVSAFALAPDWLSGRQRSAVMKRWKIDRNSGSTPAYLRRNPAGRAQLRLENKYQRYHRAGRTRRGHERLQPGCIH